MHPVWTSLLIYSNLHLPLFSRRFPCQVAVCVIVTPTILHPEHKSAIGHMVVTAYNLLKHYRSPRLALVNNHSVWH